MRVLSMSPTLRLHSSARRIPVEYIVISMARWKRLLADSISRIASSRVRIIGNRRGARGYGTSSTGYDLFSVLQKKKRSAAVCSLTVRTPSFRSCSRCT